MLSSKEADILRPKVRSARWTGRLGQSHANNKREAEKGEI
jgi:hypothetical protein